MRERDGHGRKFSRPARDRNPSRSHAGAAREHRPRHDRKSHERERRNPDRDGPVLLYGWHTVSAALSNPARRIRHLWATENAAHRLADAGINAPVAPELVRPDAIAARLPTDALHQGLLAEADPLEAGAVEDLRDGLVLVLDQLTDPHNVGAIVRTAA